MNFDTLRYYVWILFVLVSSVDGRNDEWNNVPCDQAYQPPNRDLNELNLVTVDDFDRCAPAKLPIPERNFFLGAAGRRITYKKNKDNFDRIEILPKFLRDVSNNSLETTILGLKLDFPIGLSPVAAHKLAHPRGELETVAGVSSMRTIVILSLDATTLLEDIGHFQKNASFHLWMQMYIHPNRSVNVDLVQRAEKSGFEGIVITCDAPVAASITCDARKILKSSDGNRGINTARYGRGTVFSPTASFEDIKWLKSITKLPIIAKGILSGADAVKAVKAGASAVMVSNHGGRQLDGVPAAIDVLPRVVNALMTLSDNPPKEVYMDGGVRNGNDVYKALARGAKMVFVGRPIIWGLTMQGAEGVKKVMNILKNEFNQTMILAGSSRPQDITPDTLIPNYIPADKFS